MMPRMKVLGVIFLLCAPALAPAITIGPGPAIGSNRSESAMGSGVWREEFQDWTSADLRALDTDSDVRTIQDGFDSARDLIAFYSHDDGSHMFFRVDLFDLKPRADDETLVVYVALDFAPGGNRVLPDDMETLTDHPWDVCIKLYAPRMSDVVRADGSSVKDGNWLGSYYSTSLDAVEFGLRRGVLISNGWDGVSAIHCQVYSTKYLRDQPGSDVLDTVGSELIVDQGGGTGLLSGGVWTTNTAGRAKFAVIAHANQSLSRKSRTQDHIFRNFSPQQKPGFVRLLDSAEMLRVPVNLHISGSLLMSLRWAAQDPGEADYPLRDGPTFLRRVQQYVTAGPGSLIGGALAEHIMPYFVGDVNRSAIEANSELLAENFGLRPEDMKVMHVPERVIGSDARGNVFADIAASGFAATYLDEVTHLHWWFYSNEGATWPRDCACAGWAGFDGCADEPYHHKIHRINGVNCFMINDREDQEKFGSYDFGMNKSTRQSLLRKARSPDQEQVTIVFDDWEAFAGNSFTSTQPNDNADQWDRTLRWAANHPWIEIVNLKDLLARAATNSSWVVVHGDGLTNLSLQTYEWLKRATEGSYDHWYYGSDQEESFFNRTGLVHGAWSPEGMKRYGDIRTPGTMLHDTWQEVEKITSPQLRKLAEWSFNTLTFETAWHDEDANSDSYKSKNYQTNFDRNDDCAQSQADRTYDKISGWALRLHGHIRDLGILKAASDWADRVRDGRQGEDAVAFSADLDEDTLDEFVLCNNRVFLCFEGWGARLTHAFAIENGEVVQVIGAPAANPSNESDDEGMDDGRCSALKDRYATGVGDGRYVDQDFFLTAFPQRLTNGWVFTSQDSNLTKRVTLDRGLDRLHGRYLVRQPAVGTLYTRYGLGPNQMDLMINGARNLVATGSSRYRGLVNVRGGAALVIPGKNCSFVDAPIQNAGSDGRELPLIQQFETQSSAADWEVSIAFSEETAKSP